MEKVTNGTKPNFDATPKDASPIKIFGTAPSEAAPHSEAGMDHSVSQWRIDDQFMNSLTFKTSGALNITDQLKTSKIKPKLSNSQRREALLVKLQAKGEVYDPAKWRRGKRKKAKCPVGRATGPVVGPKAAVEQPKPVKDTMDTSPSAEAPTNNGPMDMADDTVPGTSSRSPYKDTESVEAGVDHSVPQWGIDNQFMNTLNFKTPGALNITEQLKTAKVKPKLSNSQRREALLIKLQAKGEVFDPSKWRRGKRKKAKRPVGKAPGPVVCSKAAVEQPKRLRDTMDTSPSAESPTKKTYESGPKDMADDTVPGTSTGGPYKDTKSVTNIAIFPIGYPKTTLSADQVEAIEDAILDELQLFRGDFGLWFNGTFMEKGALIVSCANKPTEKWLEEVILKIKPLGEENPIRTGLHNDILGIRASSSEHP